MAYLDYNYTENDTFFGIADYYGITVTELFRINNIPYPYPQKPSQLSYLSGTLKVPEVYNGRLSLDSTDYSEYVFGKDDERTRSVAYYDLLRNALIGEVGFASQGKCFLLVEGVDAISFPCYPDSYSDSHSANFSPQTPLGRSEPFQIYQNSGPRVVSVTFKMDVEMCHTTSIRRIVGVVQSACYPLSSGSGTIAPRCTLIIGNNCSITGIIDSVSADWSETIIGNEYTNVSLNFSVKECTGSPKTADVVASLGGR